jgi:mono/diheme cytochrome c family protein
MLIRVAIVVAIVVASAGCERAVRGMYDQPRFRAMQQPAPGMTVLQPVPEGSIARPPAPVVADAAIQGGAKPDAQPAATAVPDDIADGSPSMPYPTDRTLLKRGQQRFDIYCAPCHGLEGNGQGVIALRGFPHPPSYHDERLRTAPDRHFYDVIRNGYGIMYPYADRVDVADRWAIVAYIRALQSSRNAKAADLPPSLRASLDAKPRERSR